MGSGFGRDGLRSRPRVQTNELIRTALASGYIDAVSRAIYARVIREVLRYDRPHVLLDVGGGSGELLDVLGRHVDLLVNVDPSPPGADPTEIPRSADPRYRRIVCSAEQLPLRSRSADAAVAIASLDHVPNMADALREVHRVLRPGCPFIVQLNNRRSWWKILLSGTSAMREREQAIAREHYVQLSLRELARELERLFRVRSAYSTTFFPFVPGAWRVLLPLSDMVGARFLSRHGGNSIVVCESQ